MNYKRLFRVYQAAGLSLRRKCKDRLPDWGKQPLSVPEVFTQGWSIDFTGVVVSDDGSLEALM